MAHGIQVAPVPVQYEYGPEQGQDGQGRVVHSHEARQLAVVRYLHQGRLALGHLALWPHRVSAAPAFPCWKIYKRTAVLKQLSI
jgi:hypothetical protein